LLDDRSERAGVKFKDADLIGIPIRVTVGEKGLAKGSVELKERKSNVSKEIPTGDVISQILKHLN